VRMAVGVTVPVPLVVVIVVVAHALGSRSCCDCTDASRRCST
jgi:hypothetical protein